MRNGTKKANKMILHFILHFEVTGRFCYLTGDTAKAIHQNYFNERSKSQRNEISKEKYIILGIDHHSSHKISCRF